jgi:hypothetical protein
MVFAEDGREKGCLTRATAPYRLRPLGVAPKRCEVAMMVDAGLGGIGRGRQALERWDEAAQGTKGFPLDWVGAP